MNQSSALDRLREKARLRPASDVISWDHYIELAKALFRLFRGALQPLVQEGSVRIDEAQSGIETSDGPRDVPVLLVSVGGQKVQVRLRGIGFAGDFARADVIGPAGTTRLIVDADHPAWAVLGDQPSQPVLLTEAQVPDLIIKLLGE